MHMQTRWRAAADFRSLLYLQDVKLQQIVSYEQIQGVCRTFATSQP